jgi:hypothetical protein
MENFNDIVRAGDIFTMKGDIVIDGLPFRVDHSQDWECVSTGVFKPVKIERLVLRNGWKVAFSPKTDAGF